MEYDDRPRRKGKSGKGKREVELVEQIFEDVLYAHRSVSFNAMLVADVQFCEKCQRGPADDMLEKAQEKKRKSKGKQRRKKHEDDMSDEEIAQQLEGWLTCERCVVSKHWVSQLRGSRRSWTNLPGLLVG